jgi:hypothetical protein
MPQGGNGAALTMRKFECHLAALLKARVDDGVKLAATCQESKRSQFRRNRKAGRRQQLPMAGEQPDGQAGTQNLKIRLATIDGKGARARPRDTQRHGARWPAYGNSRQKPYVTFVAEQA